LPNLIISFLCRCGQLGFSVLERGCQDSITGLEDPRLGIPTEDEKCATCGGINYENCAGETSRFRS
jgi:hypothetical protein